MSNKVPDVPNVFTQLEAALCLLARAKGEQQRLAAKMLAGAKAHLRYAGGRGIVGNPHLAPGRVREKLAGVAADKPLVEVGSR